MASKFVVQAVTRQGFAGSWRGNRFWPSNAPTEIEVVDQEADPPADPNGGTVKVGQKTFKALHADNNLRVVPAGDPMALAKQSEDVEELRRTIDRQAEEIRDLRKQLGEQGGGAGGASARRVTAK